MNGILANPNRMKIQQLYPAAYFIVSCSRLKPKHKPIMNPAKIK